MEVLHIFSFSDNNLVTHNSASHFLFNKGSFLLIFRILKPPGGMSSPIFSETDSTTSSNESRASSTSPKTPQKVYRMASNFELGDEQPENPPPRRKPFKPSGNDYSYIRVTFNLVNHKCACQLIWQKRICGIIINLFGLFVFAKLADNAT